MARHYEGPVSRVTGGPLNAIEADRVTRHQSIAHSGFVFEQGAVLCAAHGFEVPEAWVDGQGFRMTVYCGTPKDEVLGACSKCGAQVVGKRPS